METKLSAAEARVLGSLMEKSATTPEYYPLSLNALVNACNQKSSREPVMQLSEADVYAALRSLEDAGIAARVSDGRVAKYEHRVGEAWNLRRDEFAMLCGLLLRGAQTPGELRTRTERIHQFTELEAVNAALERLAEKSPAMVELLPRQPGAREARWRELLSTEAADQSSSAASATLHALPSASEDTGLRAEVDDLRRRVEELEERLRKLTS